MFYGFYVPPPEPDESAPRPEAGPAGPRDAYEASTASTASSAQRHPTPSEGPAQSGRGPVLDTTIGWTRLHADPEAISYGRKSIALDEVEWVSYSAAHIAEKRFMFPTTYYNKWDFRVGRYPYSPGRDITVHFSKPGRHAEQPAEWTFLVNLVRRYLEPRLLADLVDRVRRGETVMVGGSLKVNLDGIACTRPRFSLPWESVRVEPYNGRVWIYQAGVEKPIVSAPMENPNAGLIPALFAVLAS
jgi:hypothetical protein